MKNIYHAHTLHSNLTVKEIIKKAIDAGCETIGFVNIGPSRFGNDNMGFANVTELTEWLAQMKKIKDENKSKINVLSGVEMNFLDRFTGEVDTTIVKKVAKLSGVDYILFAHHYYPGQEHIEDVHVTDENRVAVKHSMETMIEECPVKYICHPTLFLRAQRKWDAQAEQMTYDIVNFAKENNVVLELPLDSFSLPDSDLHEKFWRIVANSGVKVHIDLDIQMVDFFTKELAIKVLSDAKDRGLNVVDKVF